MIHFNYGSQPTSGGLRLGPVVAVLGDGGAGAGFVDEARAGGAGGDERGDRPSRSSLRGLPRPLWWISAMASSVN